MKKRFLAVLATGLFALGMVGMADATLVGDSITGTGAILAPADATIGAGVEFVGINYYLNFDFGADTLTITNTAQLPLGSSLGWWGFGDYVFSDFDDQITGLSIASNTGFFGAVVDNFKYDAYSLTLDMSAGNMSYGSVLVFDISTKSAVVPEPSTILLLGGGLAGLVWCIRKRKQA